MNIAKELALVPLAQINQVLALNGLSTFTDKTIAVSHLTPLINSGAVTIDQVRRAVPTATTKVATGVPDDIRNGLLAAQAEITQAVESVRHANEQVASLVIDTEHQRQVNERKFDDLAKRLASEIKSVQGVDYSKVSNEIRSEVSKLFDEFRTSTPRDEIVQIANRVATFERKPVREVFDGSLSYDLNGETIDFSELEVSVWNDADAPVRVDDYIFNPRHLHQALVALDGAVPDNVWLAGERGTGKTEFVSQVASRLGRRLFRINFDEALERAEFIGGNTIQNGNVVWKEGVVTQAIQHPGAIVLLDEIGFARAQNLAVLHALCEPSPHRSIVIAETGVRIPVASHVVFFCADNSNGFGDASGNFAGVRDQNSAFIDRFSYTLKFEYLDFDDEVNLIVNRTGLNHDATKVLVKFANTAREKARAGILTQPPSLRQLFAWARAIQKGVPVSVAFENAIINKFPAECESELRGVFTATIDSNALKSYLTK